MPLPSSDVGKNSNITSCSPGGNWCCCMLRCVACMPGWPLEHLTSYSFQATSVHIFVICSFLEFLFSNELQHSTANLGIMHTLPVKGKPGRAVNTKSAAKRTVVQQQPQLIMLQQRYPISVVWRQPALRALVLYRQNTCCILHVCAQLRPMDAAA
jgi:hypothetical protein